MKRFSLPGTFVVLAMVLVMPFSLLATTSVAHAQPTSDDYYWLVASDGGVFSFGGAGYYGSTGNIKLNQPIVGIAPTITGEGYWTVASDGGIFSFGDADFYGSTGAIKLNKPIVGMVPTITSEGYWLVASDGGIFAFGDAQFYGSTGAIKLNKPIVGMAPTTYSEGYWLAASDGGVFAFGDAQYKGSPAESRMNEYGKGITFKSRELKAVGAARYPSGGMDGYMIYGSQAGLSGYDAPNMYLFNGSPAGYDVVGFAPKPYDGDNHGGWFATHDGGVYSSGNAAFKGSLGAVKLNKPIVGIASQIYSVDEYLDYYGIE